MDDNERENEIRHAGVTPGYNTDIGFLLRRLDDLRLKLNEARSEALALREAVAAFHNTELYDALDHLREAEETVRTRLCAHTRGILAIGK